MIDESYDTAKNDFIMALRTIYREGLSDAFGHLSMRTNDGNEMTLMPRKSVEGPWFLSLAFSKIKKRSETASKDSIPTAISPRTETE